MEEAIETNALLTQENSHRNAYTVTIDTDGILEFNVPLDTV